MQQDVPDVRRYRINIPSGFTLVQGTSFDINDSGELYIYGPPGKTLAVFAAGYWKAIEDTGKTETDGVD